MANTLTTQQILDGSRNIQLKVYIQGDGSGDLSKETLFDVSDWTYATTENKLMEIEYNLIGFSATLYWDATTDVPFMDLSADYPARQKFCAVGGLVNNGGSGRTGNILISTKGLGSIPSGSGEIVIYLKVK
jgi:hypothetical protein